MTTKESVVTRERYDSGLTWDQYLEHIQRNKSKFLYNFENTAVPADYENRLKALAARPQGPAKVLIIGEDWCPDVFRGLPVIVRIANAGGLTVRIFPRDDNLDIMNEFLNRGEHQSIPVAVFYSGDHRYITHWTERPKKAEAEMDQMRKVFEGLDREKDIDEMRRRNNEFQEGPVWAGWRDATVVEITELLESATGS